MLRSFVTAVHLSLLLSALCCDAYGGDAYGGDVYGGDVYGGDVYGNRDYAGQIQKGQIQDGQVQDENGRALIPSLVANSIAQTAYLFHIKAQVLPQSLIEFSRQSGFAVLMSSELDQAAKIQAPALFARLPAEEALKRLLDGSGLTYEKVNDQSLVIVPLIKPVQPVSEQTPSIPTSPAQTHPTLEEITVTASKRLTSLQDTPIAITAIDQQALIDNHVTSLFDFMTLVPSLQVTRRGDHSASMLYLRGVGSDNPTEAGDSGVATHVDGIYSSRSQGTAVLLYDIAQIEVLRGPQGSLFGRNSTSGVVNYHTNKPNQAFEGRMELGLGSYDYRSAQGMVNVPVTDRWALRLAGAMEEYEGQLEFAQGSASGRDKEQYNNSDLASFRLSSNWEVTNALDWWLSYEQFTDQGNGNLPAVDYDTPVLIDSLGRTDLKMDSYRSRIDWSINDNLNLAYIAGYTRMKRDQNWDGDGVSPVGSETNPAIYHQNNHTVWADYHSRQHELQFKNGDDSRLRWLLAYFYFEEESGIRFDLEHQASNGNGWGGAASHSFQQPHRGSEFSAVYGQFSYDLASQWTISLGGRTGRDRRYDRGGRNIGCPDLIRADRGGDLGIIAVNQESAAANQCFVASYNDVDQHWYNTTYMGRIEYRPTNNVLFYLMFAEGFKPGIVEDGNGVTGVFSGSSDPAFQSELAHTLALNNGNAGSAEAFVGPEESRNFELGFKLTLLDDSLTLNGALFSTAYDDLQVSSVSLDDAGTEVYRSSNAASATINGLELELNWAVSLNGQLSGQLSVLDASYDRFLTVDSSFPQYGQTWNPSANDPAVPDLVDFGGNQMKQAPKFRFSLAYKHHFHFDNGSRLTPYVLATWSDEVYFSEANRGQRTGQLLDNQTGQWVPDPNGAAEDIDLQPAYWWFDVSLKFEPASARWWLEGFINNLTDEQVRYDASAPEATAPRFYLAAPRTFGVRIGANFQ